MSWLLLSLLAVSSYFLWHGISLVKLYLQARKTGWPVLVAPVPQEALWWLVGSVPLRHVFARLLPKPLYYRINMTIYGWEFKARYEPFESIGSKTFMLTNCSVNVLMIADPDLSMDVLKRVKDFERLELGNKVLGVFGSNLLACDHENWTRQRRVIAPALNERISDVVFKESCRQASEMLQYFTSRGGVTDATLQGLKDIAIHVLAAAGYGLSSPWKEEKRPPKPGYKLTYIEAVESVIDNIVAAAMLPAWVFLMPFLPSNLRRIGYAKREFPAHTQETLAEERLRAATRTETQSNLMSMLVKIADDGKQDPADKKSRVSKTLSEEEIMGNLFVFTSAGFDTTANTMAYAVTMLAAYPQWQDWIVEEIDEVLQGKGREVEYTETYPKLVRCLALMVSLFACNDCHSLNMTS